MNLTKLSFAAAWAVGTLSGALAFPGEPFIRGDVNGDGIVDASDALETADVLFLGEATSACGDVLDANDDGEHDIADAIKTLIFANRNGRHLPVPGRVCADAPGQGIECDELAVYQPGYDVTPDAFDCGDTFVAGRESGRPVPIHVPASYDPETPMPLIFFLHGGGGATCVTTRIRNVDFGAWTEASRNFRALADERGFLYAHPNAPTYDLASSGCPVAWNGTATFGFLTVDDSSYLRGLIEETRESFNVDPKRIFIIGRSNGGGMAHRMACEHSDLLAAVVSIAGRTHNDPADCPASAPIHVLQIHGTADDVLSYEGTESRPGAVGTVERWAALNGCVVEPEALPPLDLEVDIDGSGGAPEETIVTRYAMGCGAGGSAELWTIPGGTHVPGLLEPWVEPFPERRPNPAFSKAVIDWLFAHPKP